MTDARATGPVMVGRTPLPGMFSEPVPFFATRASPSRTPRRILLISYSFTPSVQIGARRWHHLSRFAANRGWATDVLMMDPADEGIADYSLLHDLPRGVRLFRIPLGQTAWHRVDRALSRPVKWMLGRASRGTTPNGPTVVSGQDARRSGEDESQSVLRQWRRVHLASLFFHQADAWMNQAAWTGLQLHRSRPYDLVVSSGPPHMAHGVARRIARSAKLPFVVDLRDPIVHPALEPRDMQSELWRSKCEEWEQVCLGDAALVVVTAEGMRLALNEKYPEARERVLTVMNGSDRDVPMSVQRDSTFVIASTGTIYMGRDPGSLFQALAQLVSRRQLSPDEIRVHFMGDTLVRGIPLEHLADKVGVSPYVTVEATRPRSEARALMGRAAMLMILPQSVPETIPAKLFEYVQAPAWILALAENGSSVERLLRDTGADVLPPNDIDGIAARIEARLASFRRGERPTPLNHDGAFDREAQALRLFEAFDRLVPRS